MEGEGRALASSYAAAISLALLWVLVVQLTPRPIESPLPAPVAIIWRDLPRQPTLYQPVLDRAGRSVGVARPARDAGATVADAFRRGAGTVVDALGALRGVAVTRGRETPAAIAGKIVLESDEAGVGSRRPGLDPLGTAAGAGSAAGVGRVGVAAGVAHTRTEVSLPPVVVAPPTGAGARSAGELGVAVRARAAQLQSCYEREGRSRNPELAGTVVVTLTVAGTGEVTASEIARHSWSGAGTAETEACVRSLVRAWRFRNAAVSAGSYSFPVSFTAGR